jgi:hypothetical protein
MGLIGAIAVTPTTFLLPPLFWIMFKKPPKWGWEWTLNASLVVVTAVLGVIGMVSGWLHRVASQLLRACLDVLW